MYAVPQSRGWLLLVTAITLMAVGCSGQPAAPEASRISNPPVTMRPETPTPEPSPWSSGWPQVGYGDYGTFDACYKGTPVPGAAPYAGKVHPLIVEDMSGHWGGFDINGGFPWSPWSWPSPIQLVVCVTSLGEKQVGSCGLYKNESGEVGTVLRYQDRAEVEVVIAATGKTLQKRTLANPAPKCPKKFTAPSGVWSLHDPVTQEQINKYATAVSKQPVK